MNYKERVCAIPLSDQEKLRLGGYDEIVKDPRPFIIVDRS
jgi:hypothetical protein